MMTQGDLHDFNPYSASALEPDSPLPRKLNWLRGLAWAVPCGFVGFVVPFTVGAGFILAHYFSADYPWRDVIADFHELPQKYESAAIGCAAVFALAAMLNFTPEKKIGYVRSLMFVGLVLLANLFVTGLLFSALWPEVREDTVELRRLAAFAFFLGVPCLYVVAHVLHISRRTRAAEEPEAPNENAGAVERADA